MASIGPARRAIFGYGSNGTAQLRARCQNPQLVTRGACAPGWLRVFCGVSENWGGGGYATLVPAPAASADGTEPYTLGSVAWLDARELELLTAFEGGYTLRAINVVDALTGERIAAEAFICNHLEYRQPPSEQYLTAIHCHLREHFGENMASHAETISLSSSSPLAIDIRHWDHARQCAVAIGEPWRHPGCLTALSLPALMIELNAHAHKRDKWVVPRHVRGACEAMLQSYNVRGTHDVVRHALAFDAAAASPVLPGFSTDDMSLLRDLLHAEHLPDSTPTSSSSISPASAVQSAADASILLFVYGSLRRGQVNHHVLEKRQCKPYDAVTPLSSGQGSALSSVPAAAFHTVHPYTMLGLASGAYPFVIDRQHASSFASSSSSSTCADVNEETTTTASSLRSTDQDAWLPPATPIVGEIYRMPIAELAALDAFEGDDYTRRVVACRRAPSASASSSSSSSARTDDGGEIVYASMYMAVDAEVRRALLSRVRELHRTGVVLVPGGDWAAHLADRAS